MISHAFLEDGCIFSVPEPGGLCPSEDVWVGWGSGPGLATVPLLGLGLGLGLGDGLRIYAPDYFLRDLHPWREFAKTVRISKRRLVQELELMELSGSSDTEKARLTLDFCPAQFEKFRETFDDLKSRIEMGELKKAVPYSFKFAPNPVSVSDRRQLLIALLKNTTGFPINIYGMWNSEEGILGATPEVLLSCGDKVQTMALAGTRIYADMNSERLPLLEDPKERAEHQLVIEGILSSVQAEVGLGVRVLGFELGTTQELRLPTLAHLYTPIKFIEHSKSHESTWNTNINKMEWVRALHPTPALGAYPKKVGMEWLEKLATRIPRRRFGAPFGAVFPGGASFHCVVAIRNIQWDLISTMMGAGCGVIAASQLDREWAELQGKFRSIEGLFGLGVNLKQQS